MFYFSQEYTAALERTLVVERTCPSCRVKRYGRVDAAGSGQGTAPYGVGRDKAQANAQTRALAALIEDATFVATLTPCGGCGARDGAARKAYWRGKIVAIIVAPIFFSALGAVFVVQDFAIAGAILAAFGFTCAIALGLIAYRRFAKMSTRIAWRPAAPEPERGFERKTLFESSGLRISYDVAEEAPAEAGLEPSSDDTHSANAASAIELGEYETARRELLRIRTADRARDYRRWLETAQGLERGGRDMEAYETYRRMLQVYPAIARANAQVVASVRRLEGARNVEDSIVPPRKVGRELFVVAALVVVVAGIVIAADAYLRDHRTLHVTNGTRRRATITRPGSDATAVVAAGQRGRIDDLPGGTYPIHVALDDGTAYDVEVALEDGVFGRWMQSTVFVLNVLRSDILVAEEVLYGSYDREAEYGYAFGEDFLVFEDIDYVFTEPPGSIDTKASRTSRWMLSRLREPPRKVLADMVEAGAEGPAVLAYAEGVVRGGHDEPEIIAAYRTLCARIAGEGCAARLGELGLVAAEATE